jgi:hypothetical protein
MVFGVEDAINDCVEVTASSPDVHAKFADVWNAMIRQCNKTLNDKKGIFIPKLGKITWVKTTKKPIFVASDHFVRTHGIHIKKHAATLQTNCVELNYSRIAHECNIDKDLARTMIETLINRFGEVIGGGKETVKLSIGKIGDLYGENRNAVFRFRNEKREKRQPGDGSSGPSFSKNAPASAMGLSLTGGSFAGTQNSGYGMPSQRESSYGMPSQRESSYGGSEYQDSMGPETVAQDSSFNASASVPSMSTTKVATHTKKGLGGPGFRTRNKAKATKVPTSTLKGSHFQMMSGKKNKEQAEKDDQREFDNAALSEMRTQMKAQMQASAAKTREAKELASFQRQQASDALSVAKKEASVEKYLDTHQPWPFKTEEQVTDDRRMINEDFRAGLDSQMDSQPQKPEKKSIQSAFTRSKMSGTHNVFPSFLDPERTVSMAHYTPAEVYDATMDKAWNTYEKDLRSNENKVKKDFDDTRMRRERSELLHKRREIERMREMQELNQFLKEQARYKQKLDHDFEHERFYGKDPDPSLAYPVQRVRKMDEEQTLKGTLKDSLDAQVAEKDDKVFMQKRQEMQEDSFFLECNHERLMQDRNFRKHKAQEEKQMLTSTWSRQNQLANRGSAIQKAGENNLVFHDTVGRN